MASPPRRQIAWILLLAALSQPAWALAHAWVHDHLAHHHAGSAASEAAPHLVESDPSAHDHAHLDDALIVSIRTPQTVELAALPSFSPSPNAHAARPVPAAPEGLPARASPVLGAPAHPRAPPHA